MPVLSISKTFQDGDVLFEVDLDNIRNDLETFINSTKLNDDNIQDAGITASSKFVDNSLTTGKIASGAVTAAKIASDSVSTTKIADSNVTTAKILDSNVTTPKIADGAVTTAKINDGAVTYAKKSMTTAVTSNCGSFSSSDTSNFVAVTNLSLSFTTIGGKFLKAQLVQDSGAAASGFMYVSLFVNGVSTASLNNIQPYFHPVYFTLASAGTYTLSVRMKAGFGTPTITNYKLLIIEE